MYNDLPNSLKAKFREAWQEQKNFQFFKEAKRSVQTSEHAQGKMGRMLTLEGIASALGNATSPTCLLQAQNWVNNCERLGGSWVEFSEWLGVNTYKFFEKQEPWA